MASRAISTVASSSRSFSTTAAVLAAKGPKKTAVVVAGKRKTFGKGGNRQKTIMGPMTKGIKLAYSMASEAPDLSEFDLYPMRSMDERSIGKPTTIAKRELDALKAFGLPRGLDQEFAKNGGAALVIRKQTVDLLSTLNAEAGSSSQDARYMLSGVNGSGKTALLLQAVAQALASNWIVLYAPRAQSWIDSSSAYAYDPASQTYHQPNIAAGLLETLSTVNKTRIAGMKVDGKAMPTFIQESIRAGDAVAALEKVMAALAEQTEYPVLFAIDEVHSLFSVSAYRSPSYELIEPYHLSTPRLALDYLTGIKTFARGMTLSTFSYSTPHRTVPTDFSYALELPTREPISPYTKFHKQHLAHASSGFKKIEVPFGMSAEEALGMFEVWSRKGLVHKANDEVFMSAYIAASGNPKELRRGWVQDKSAYARFDQNTSRIGTAVLSWRYD